jgi:hypothetical protein
MNKSGATATFYTSLFQKCYGTGAEESAPRSAEALPLGPPFPCDFIAGFNIPPTSSLICTVLFLDSNFFLYL